jgi:hypothetical protein
VIRRRDSLQEALAEIEQGGLAGVLAVVVSRAWWDSVSSRDQRSYGRRCAERRIELRVDDRMCRHFVEVIDGPGERRLSTERPAIRGGSWEPKQTGDMIG